MRKNKEKIIIENLEIIDIASEGKSIAKHNDLVIFVRNAVPGDIADIQIINKKSNFYEGVAVNFHKYSEKRVTAFCEHFGLCGGCKWQNLSYEDQLFYKHKQVVENIKHIGKVDDFEVLPIFPSSETTYYRNKLEFTFSNHRWLQRDEIGNENIDYNGLGFYMPKMFDRVLNINHCYLQREPSNSIRLALKKYAHDNNLSFYDIRKGVGFLRNIIIRTSNTNEVMLIVAFFYDDKIEINKLLNFVSEKFPEITSLMYFVNPKSNDSYSDLDIKLFKGLDYITEQMGDLKFKIGPKSFYQTNSGQALNLYKIARNFAELKGDENVYDLYTGTGTIANYIASDCKKVIGIDCIDDAIEDAKINASINNITNAKFFNGDVINVLTDDFIKANGNPDVVILDPPRAGLHPNMIKILNKIKPLKIVYISCGPSTQARDINMLKDNYTLIKIQPVDMFPHTHHVENVAVLNLIV